MPIDYTTMDEDLLFNNQITLYLNMFKENERMQKKKANSLI